MSGVQCLSSRAASWQPAPVCLGRWPAEASIRMHLVQCDSSLTCSAPDIQTRIEDALQVTRSAYLHETRARRPALEPKTTEMTMNCFEPNDPQKRLIEDSSKRAELVSREDRYAPDSVFDRMSQEAAGVLAVVPMTPENGPPLTPTIFLDVDDVLALNQKFGGRDVQQAMAHPGLTPSDLYSTVFSAAAVESLNELLREFNPRVVLTTSWLALLQREHFLDLFEKTGVQIFETSLHSKWDAQQDFGTSRLDAIERWLTQNHQGEPIVVLDDHASGEGLVGSLLHEAGRVVLCDVDVGFNRFLLQAARDALLKPFDPLQPWQR